MLPGKLIEIIVITQTTRHITSPIVYNSNGLPAIANKLFIVHGKSDSDNVLLQHNAHSTSYINAYIGRKENRLHLLIIES